MDDLAWGRATPGAGEQGDLDWYQWLETQWGGQGASPLEADWSQHGPGRGSPTGSLKLDGTQPAQRLVSLSQQQMHTQSTAACYGPAAQKLFHQQVHSRRRISSGQGRRSVSPTQVRIGTNGHMRQRATTSHGGGPRADQTANQGTLGAGMMTQTKPWGRPLATWVDNRRVSRPASLSAVRASNADARRNHRITQLSQPVTREQTQQQRALRHKELRQKRQQREEEQQRLHAAKQQLGQTRAKDTSLQRTRSQRSRHDSSKSAPRTNSPPRHDVRTQSNPSVACHA